ncbi:MAG: hypothetical protein IPP17_19165 [Bacteroidetes bacterium]|nr:hypothetical protein [Bacteroidota bacterium]
MAYFLYWGTLLEIDSLGYLKLQTALYHPPLYSVFNGLAIQIGRSVDAIVVAQSLLYSLSASLLVRKWITTSRFQLLIAILLALEPCSGKLACTVMAETVFLSLLMLAWLALPTLKSENWKRFSLAAICIGFALGLAYQTRYAAPVFVVAVIIWMLTQRLPWRRLALGTGIILLAFQFALLPLRMYYQVRFGTLQTNAFSSLSLWNTSAYLYPDSRIAAAPKTAFERYLICFPLLTMPLPHLAYQSDVSRQPCLSAVCEGKSSQYRRNSSGSDLGRRHSAQIIVGIADTPLAGVRLAKCPTAVFR